MSDFGDVFQAIYIAKQKPAPSAVVEEMKVQLQSYPPLGQVTPVESGNIAFTAVLEIPQARAKESWEVALWQSVDEGEWTEASLSSTEAGQQPVDLQTQSESMSKAYFTATLSFHKSLRFTLKFRHEKSEPWRWIRDEQGLGDGFIVATSAAVKSEELSGFIPDLAKEWTVSSCMSQSPRTRLWSLETTVPPAQGETSTFKDLEIGTPWGSFLRWFALVRLWSPWLAPRQGKTSFSLDKDGVLCSFLSPQGKNLVLLALSGINDVLSVFHHTPSGAVAVHARNDGTTEQTATILVAEGDDFEGTVAAVMYQARSLVIQTQKMSPEWDAELHSLGNEINPEWLENWYDGLGYCTWNALGQKLTEKKVLDAVDKLAEHKIKFTSLIIDDNWQSLDYRGHGQFQHGWVEFEAEPDAFPNGLKATVSKIREKHPGIQHVAVWHAILGYWGGIAPDGKIANTYKTVEVAREDADRRNLPLGGKMTVVAKDDVSKFYDDFYRFLSDAGVDAVKTDAQFMMDTWVDATPRRELMKTYLDSWTISALRYFSVKSISCMSQTPQALFYSQMPQNRPTMLVRNSDDFFPEIPASHPWHVWTNAHNSIFMQHLNVLPDWDMFQTVHDYSGFHAAARCVSGGPIYITDVPGEHNIDLIRQMTGVTPRGKTVIFRPSVVGRSIDPYTSYDDESLLKVGSYHGASGTGTPILAIFNVSLRSLTEIVPLSSFPGAMPNLTYVVRAHTTGKVSSPSTIGAPTSLITTSLETRGFEIFTAFPQTRFTSKVLGEMLVSSLGLLGKMTGCAAIVRSHIAKIDNGRILFAIKIKALGVLGIYLSTLPSMTIDGDFMVTIQGNPIPRHTVSVSKDDKHVLEVDVERAWKERELSSGWSNEVEVKIYCTG